MYFQKERIDPDIVHMHVIFNIQEFVTSSLVIGYRHAIATPGTIPGSFDKYRQQDITTHGEWLRVNNDTDSRILRAYISLLNNSSFVCQSFWLLEWRMFVVNVPRPIWRRNHRFRAQHVCLRTRGGSPIAMQTVASIILVERQGSNYVDKTTVNFPTYASNVFKLKIEASHNKTTPLEHSAPTKSIL